MGLTMLNFNDPLFRESGNRLINEVARLTAAAERKDYGAAADAMLALANVADLLGASLAQSAHKRGEYISPIARARIEREGAGL